VIPTIVIAWAALGSLVMAWAVASDARSRGLVPWLWFVITLCFNVFGVLAYLVIRPPLRTDEDVVDSEPIEEAIPMPAGVPAGPTRWERPSDPLPRYEQPAEVEYAETLDEQDAPLTAGLGGRVWIFVGVAVFLGLVVVAALVALITSPGGTGAGPGATATQRPAATVAAAATTAPPALLAPTPTVLAAQPAATEPPAAPPTAAAQQQPTQYVVRAGDTLGSIASRYGVTVKQIQDANDLSGETIFEGQKLKIPQPAQ